MQAFQYLKNRGLIYQTSQLVEEALKTMTSSQSIYLGVDPTAKGLHIGHLVACRVLKRFHDMGVKCIALVGGATALIGDPSFKVQERSILSAEDVQENVKEIQKDMEHVLGSGGDDHLLFVNNYDWYKEMNVIDFLRDVGKNMRVQSMLAKDSVSKRINSENSMSFAEFAYQCLQSNDFLHLHQRFGCICQVGGSDQWGNITSGIDFVKRVTSHSVHGITVPLLTNSQGHKFGKSEGNAVWIDKARTSNVLLTVLSSVARLLPVLPAHRRRGSAVAASRAHRHPAGEHRRAAGGACEVSGEEGGADGARRGGDDRHQVGRGSATRQAVRGAALRRAR